MLLLSQWVAAVNLTSADPYWIGGASSFGTTEGNDYWVTFPNNNQIDPQAAQTQGVTFELELAFSARQATQVVVEISGVQVALIDVPANQTEIFTIPDGYYQQVYLLESEDATKYKGVHVYSADRNKSFSCFSYNRNGVEGATSRDASLVIPTKFLGKEYFIQTYPDDGLSTEFGIVATDAATTVHIYPATQTSGGQAAGTDISYTLEKGQAVLIASAPRSTTPQVDLSGSRICADKPIAVFCGNQQTSIPYNEAYSKDFMCEQIMPVSQWGTDFYLGLLGSSNRNYARMTALYDGTEITVKIYNASSGTVMTQSRMLNKGQSVTPPINITNTLSELTIHSNLPMVCFDYMTSAAVNTVSEIDPATFEEISYTFGDPANAMMPSWNQNVTSMNFFTHDLDPQNPEDPKNYYVYLVTKATNIVNTASKISIDGTPVPSSAFHPFHAEPTMVYANIAVTNPATHYHLVQSSGDGFVGMVYAVTSAQGYLYTLGYSATPYKDTLVVENPEALMSRGSYDLPRLPQGWYQRQIDEWKEGHERLDTAVVCEDGTVNWLIQTPAQAPVTKVEWKLFDVTGKTGVSEGDTPISAQAETDATVPSTTEHRWDYTFTLPDQSNLPADQRTPLYEYELQTVLERSHLICTDLEPDRDTMRTTVRVTRHYDDTIHRAICMGDTLKFFYDSLYRQSNLSLKGTKADTTFFIADKTSGDATAQWRWKAHLGHNYFHREYKTIYGCDSLVTLHVFVCDTFRTVDTLHLCANETITYLGGTDLAKTYRGAEAVGNADMTVAHDIIDIIKTKTKFCPCQLAPYKDTFPNFEGCDSIFELHLFVHPIHRDTLVDTMCYNRKPDSIYFWPIQKGTSVMQITKSHPNMQYDAGLRSWWGFFSDTLRTKTCPKCNGGQGCDSINVLKLYIPEPFYKVDKDSICAWNYDYDTRTKVANKYFWVGHRNNNAAGDYLPATGVYYDSCVTRFGCDSIYKLHLRYTAPFIDSTFHSMANNQTYTWHGRTYGPFEDPEFKDRDTDTTLYFYDANAIETNKGCDSIWRLDLRISDTYLFKYERTICDIDSVHWRDSIVLGAKWKGTANTKDIRLTTDTTFVIFDSLKTKTQPERDSVYQLTITQYPTFYQYDTLHVCDNDSLKWQDQWYKGALGTRDDVRAIGSVNPKHCDSTYYLHLIVEPTFYHLNYDTICQHVSNKYVWKTGVDTRTDTISLSRTGTFTYFDSLETKNPWKCDSVYELRLTILPSYYIVDIDTISEEKTYTWNINHITYGGSKTTDSYNEEVSIGWKVVTIPGETNPVGTHKCDSTHELRLLVGPVYRDTTHQYVCATEDSFDWLGKDHAGNDSIRRTLTDLPASETHKYFYDSLKTSLNFDSIYVLDLYRAPSYIKEENGTVCQYKTFDWTGGHDTVNIKTDHAGDFDFYHYLKTDSFQCDSIWILHLHVDTVYNELTDTSVCQNIPFEWKRHEGHTLWDKQKNIRITDISSAHIGTYEFVDSLTTVAGCDSVWTLRLRVDSVYSTAVEVTERYMCDKDTLHFFDEIIYGAKSPLLPSGTTGISVPDGERSFSFDKTITYKTIHGCDSAVSHHFMIFKTYEQTKTDSVCQGDVYSWSTHETHNLWDVRQGKRIAASAIPTDVAGGITYVYIDSLRTKNCPVCNGNTGGCDSIWILELRVDSVYDHPHTKTISDEEAYEWEGTIYLGNKVNKDTVTSTLPQVVIPEGSIINNFEKPFQTIHGCDSIERLQLKVGKTYRDTIWETICDNEPYHWYHAGDPNHREARTDLTILTPGLYYDSLLTVEFGFDSIFVLDLSNYPTYHSDTTDTVICQNEPFVWLRHEGRTIWDQKYNRHVSASDVPTNESDTLYFIDTLKTINGCDSIWTLRLYVPPTHSIPNSKKICANDSLHWQGMLYMGYEFAAYHPSGYDASGFRRVQTLHAGEHNDTAWYHTEGFGCDSIYHLTLTVDTIYRDTIERRTCQDALHPYLYEPGQGISMYLPSAHLSDSLMRNDTLHAVSGCDSIVTLRFYVDSVYNFGRKDTVCQVYEGEWTWYEDGIPQRTISIDRGDTTWILGRRYETIHGCDSIYGITIYIAPIYHIYDEIALCESDSLHWQGMLFTGSQYTTYGKTYEINDFDSTKLNLREGEYDFFVRRETYLGLGCDSTHHLHLTVNPVHRETIERRICQNPNGYYYENLNNGVGGLLPSRFLSDALTRNDTIQTVLGCDSIVTLNYFVDSVYDYRQVIKVCQDTINSQWEWIDDEGHSHGYIDISVAKDIDSIEAHTTIHGCDSVYGVSLHIAPIYRFDSVYHICENERLVWQGRQYTGDSVRNVDLLNDSIILKPGLHYDTARYTTREDCDSIFYVQIYVHPTFDTTSYFSTCHNETFIWHQTDKDGSHEDLVWTQQLYDTVYINSDEAIAAAADVPNIKFMKDTLMRYSERMLKTVYGCDSLSRLWLKIHPTYFFRTDTTICSNEVMRYRGKYFMSKDTTYTEKLTTAEGCDSIYQLHLHVKPAFIETRYRSICDNETLIFPEDGRIVWKPGDNIPDLYDHTDFSYLTQEGCDSIYRYYVTINKTYYFPKDTTFASGDSVLIQGNHYVGIDTLYDVDTYQLPIDTIFIDSLKTVTCANCMNGVGCDSVYRINAHILPQYYHLDLDTICANKSTAWREHTYENLTPGLYITFDSLKTIEHNTDSVYEFRLVVWSDYYEELTTTMCADDSLLWQGRVLRDITPGDHFYYDSLESVHGCDSVYHLYLTVLDTTMEVNFDTICYNDTLHVLDHIYTIPGDYKDTTLNDIGCHHFIYTHLAIIPPTVPTVWADSMCSQELAFDLYYTYTSHDPISYSLYYDSLGHAMGFEDMIDIPITDYTSPMTITIPTPFRDGDRTKYPRPDNYGFRLVLDNGFCQRPQEDCYADSTFVMSYPAWLTEQRYGDVIALLNEQYNGGYTWTEYQWYLGDSMLVGQTLPYLYMPTGLIVGEQYYVRLTRTNEKEDFQTCPITVAANPIGDTFAPTMGYLSVTPTCVVSGHPYINILSRKDGAYRITNSSGQFVSEGVFRADVTEVKVPEIQGMYIVQLWSNDTPEEPYRAIKILVREKCENCSTPF